MYTFFSVPLTETKKTLEPLFDRGLFIVILFQSLYTKYKILHSSKQAQNYGNTSKYNFNRRVTSDILHIIGVEAISSFVFDIICSYLFVFLLIFSSSLPRYGYSFNSLRSAHDTVFFFLGNTKVCMCHSRQNFSIATISTLIRC